MQAAAASDQAPIESPNEVCLRIFADMASLTHIQDTRQACAALHRIAATCIRGIVDLQASAI